MSWIRPRGFAFEEWPSAKGSAPLGSTSFTRRRVGQMPASVTQQGIDYLDAYTYGGASQALSEGQAMLAWAELAKAQNTPSIQSVRTQYSASCPAGFLFSPTGKTCVNQEGVHVDIIRGEPNWFGRSPVVLHVMLHAPQAITAGFNQTANAFLAAIRALGMTTGATGWDNVKSHARALANVVAINSDASVDEAQEQILKRIAPYYDADVKIATSNPKRFFRTPIAPASEGSWLFIGAVVAGALYYFRPELARGLASKGVSAGKSLVTKARGAIGR